MSTVLPPLGQNLSENSPVAEEELKAWVRSLYGPDKRFKSARTLSLASYVNGKQLNENTAGKVEGRGRARPETLKALARAAGRPEEEPLRILGTIPYSPDAIDPHAQRASQAIQAAPEGMREFLADTVEWLIARGQSPDGEAVLRAGLQGVNHRQ